MLQGQAPRFSGDAEALGVPGGGMGLDLEWARAFQPDLPKLRAYKDLVVADTEAYLNTLVDDDLDRLIDLTAVGLGHQSLGWVLSALLAAHLNNMAGEISALKGLQGLQGYPF
jgi:hypothetical protein